LKRFEDFYGYNPNIENNHQKLSNPTRNIFLVNILLQIFKLEKNSLFLTFVVKLPYSSIKLRNKIMTAWQERKWGRSPGHQYNNVSWLFENNELFDVSLLGRQKVVNLEIREHLTQLWQLSPVSGARVNQIKFK